MNIFAPYAAIGQRLQKKGAAQTYKNSGKRHLFQIGFAALLARKQNPAKRYAFLKTGDKDLSFMFEPVLQNNTPAMDDNEYMKKKYYSWLVYEAAKRGQLDTKIENSNVDEKAAKRFWAGRRGTGWAGSGKGGYMQSLDPGAASDGGYGTGYDSPAKEAEELMKTYMRYIYGAIELPLENMSKVASADLINTVGNAAVKQMQGGSYKNQVPPLHTFHTPGPFYVPPTDPPKDGTDKAIQEAIRAYFQHFVSNPTMNRTSYSVGNIDSAAVQQIHSKLMEKQILSNMEGDSSLSNEDFVLEQERYTALEKELTYGGDAFYKQQVGPKETISIEGKKVTVKEYAPGQEPLKYTKFLEGGLQKNFPKLFEIKGKGMDFSSEKKTKEFISTMRYTLNKEIRDYQMEISKDIWGQKKPYFKPAMARYDTLREKFYKELKYDMKNQMMGGYNKLLGNRTKLPKYQPTTGWGDVDWGTELANLRKFRKGGDRQYDPLGKDWFVRDSSGLMKRLDLGAKSKERFKMNNNFRNHIGKANPNRNAAAGEVFDVVMAPFFDSFNRKHSESARKLKPQQRGHDLYMEHPLGTLRLRITMFYRQGTGWARGKRPAKGEKSSEGMWQVSIQPKIFYDISKDIRQTAFNYKKGAGTKAKWDATVQAQRDLNIAGELNGSSIMSSYIARQNVLLGGLSPTQTIGTFVDSVVPEEMAKRLEFIVGQSAHNWFYGEGLASVMDLSSLEGGDFKSWAMKWDKEAKAFQERSNKEFEADWARWVMTIGGGATSQPPSVARAWHPPLFLGPFVHSLKYLGYGQRKWSKAVAGYYENPKGTVT